MISWTHIELEKANARSRWSNLFNTGSSPWGKYLKPPIMHKQQVSIDYNYFGNPQSVAGPIGLHIEINTIKDIQENF